jgi:hypothetical protein
MGMGSHRGLWMAGAGTAALLAATLLAYRAPPALGPTVSPTIFSASRAQGILEDLVGDGVPHPIGSAENAKVRERIVARLTALGYTTELQAGLVCNDFGGCGTPTNIVATYGPETAVKDAVLLTAHYDSVPAGPGASDDGAGVANLLEIARILTVTPARRHPIVILVTDGEEAGLLGALLFTREHRLAPQVWAAVNMEARGVSGPSLMFETGTANAWLMHRYAAAMLTPITNSLFYLVYKTLPNNTDFTVFKAVSYQGFNFAFIGDVAGYHTPLDGFAHTSSSTLQHQGDNALSAALALADSADVRPPAQDSVFFDVFARGVVVWPTTWILPAALLAWLLLMAQAAILIRRGQLHARQAAYGAIGVLANVVLGGALSFAVLALLRVMDRLPPIGAPSWIAHPQAMHIGFAALAVSSTGAVAGWFAHRAGFWGFWLGGSLSLALLSIACAVAAPGASYVLLLGALAAALAPFPCVWLLARGRTPSQGALDFAALAPGLIMLASLLPLLLLMYSALGALAWPITTLALCLTGCFLLPLLANATAEARGFIMRLSSAVTFGCICVTVLLPTYSAAWPQRMNVEYWVDAQRGAAHWWMQAASQHLPEAMGGIAHFDPLPRARFAGYPGNGFFADAPAVKLAAPELAQLSATPGTSPATVHFELLMKSPRGAPTGFVVFPAHANVQEVVVATRTGPLRAKLLPFRSGATVLRIAGVPNEGFRFGIDAAAAPIQVMVFDQSDGLPEGLAQGKALQQARPQNATSSQDGDVTVVQRTVRLDPAAGR